MRVSVGFGLKVTFYCEVRASMSEQWQKSVFENRAFHVISHIFRTNGTQRNKLDVY